MVELVYRVIAHYMNGGIEACGEMETQEAAIKRIKALHNLHKDRLALNPNGAPAPCEYEIKLIVREFD
jgi:hypothetical protein